MQSMPVMQNTASSSIKSNRHSPRFKPLEELQLSKLGTPLFHRPQPNLTPKPPIHIRHNRQFVISNNLHAAKLSAFLSIHSRPPPIPFHSQPNVRKETQTNEINARINPCSSLPLGSIQLMMNLGIEILIFVIHT